jgi:hypothetical protein
MGQVLELAMAHWTLDANMGTPKSDQLKGRKRKNEYMHNRHSNQQMNPPPRHSIPFSTELLFGINDQFSKNKKSQQKTSKNKKQKKKKFVLFCTFFSEED